MSSKDAAKVIGSMNVGTLLPILDNMKVASVAGCFDHIACESCCKILAACTPAQMADWVGAMTLRVAVRLFEAMKPPVVCAALEVRPTTSTRRCVETFDARIDRHKYSHLGTKKWRVAS